jgi:hypothetical protein
MTQSLIRNLRDPKWKFGEFLGPDNKPAVKSQAQVFETFKAAEEVRLQLENMENFVIIPKK